MKTHVWDNAIGYQAPHSASRPGRPRRKSIAQILREAYRRHVRDRVTRQAVKCCLH